MITIPSASNLEMNTIFNSRDKYSLFKAHVMAWGHVTPSHLGVTRGDHVSRPTLKIMILMINILQNIPLDPPPLPHDCTTQSISLYQHGHSHDDGPAQMRYS